MFTCIYNHFNKGCHIKQYQTTLSFSNHPSCYHIQCILTKLTKPPPNHPHWKTIFYMFCLVHHTFKVTGKCWKINFTAWHCKNELPLLELTRFALCTDWPRLFAITTAFKYFLCFTDVENLWIILNTFLVKL